MSVYLGPMGRNLPTGGAETMTEPWPSVDDVAKHPGREECARLIGAGKKVVLS